jgi:hypothetical protein
MASVYGFWQDSGQKLRLLIGRVGELTATLTGFALFIQYPVHRAQGTVINALVQQGSEYRGWRAILEAFQVKLRFTFRSEALVEFDLNLEAER